MDWWLAPIGVGVIVLLWYLWEAAFHSGETVTAMPELDGYIPAERSGRDRRAENEHSKVEPAASASRESVPEAHAEPVAADQPEDVGADHVALPEADVGGGTWVELDVEPLFPSSEVSATHLVDLTEEHERESSP